MTARDLGDGRSRGLPLPRRSWNVLIAEWTKVRSVRSTLWTLVVAAVTAVGGSVIVAVSVLGGGRPPLDTLASIYLAWAEYPVLAVGILGVLAFTSEFSSGQIRTTFTAVPHRRAVLAAKAAIIGVITLAVGEVLSFAAFLIAAAILSKDQADLSLARPGVLGAVASAGVALCAITVLGVALGAIIRHTAGAVAALPALLYLPLVVALLPAPWNTSIGRFTMLEAAYQTVALHPQTNLLSPGLSMLVLLAWPALGLLVATALIGRDT